MVDHCSHGRCKWPPVLGLGLRLFWSGQVRRCPRGRFLNHLRRLMHRHDDLLRTMDHTLRSSSLVLLEARTLCTEWVRNSLSVICWGRESARARMGEQDGDIKLTQDMMDHTQAAEDEVGTLEVVVSRDDEPGGVGTLDDCRRVDSREVVDMLE